MLKILRPVSLVEATSFLVLLVFSAVKAFGGSQTGVHVMGPVHGVLFIAYVVLAVGAQQETRWSLKTLGFVLLGSVVPFGGFVVHQKILVTQPVISPSS